MRLRHVAKEKKNRALNYQVPQKQNLDVLIAP